jgi:glycosyltransferase involved in cell wall biosynthesis
MSRDTMLRNVLVALPVFNESAHADEVLVAIRRYAQNVLVVNDGSTDGTARVLRSHTYLRVITHRTNVGYGRSLIDAFDYAQKHGFTWVITIDCDRQHEPCRIPLFYCAIERNTWDIISGSRYLRNGDSHMTPAPPERTAINRTVAALLNRHLSMSLTDAFCGFKAYRVRAISKLVLDEPGYGLPLQLWVQASRTRLSIREVPVPLIYHDPRRTFAGELEDPRTRLQYYCAVIGRELGYDVKHEAEELLCASHRPECCGRSGFACLARVCSWQQGHSGIQAGEQGISRAAAGDGRGI